MAEDPIAEGVMGAGFAAPPFIIAALIFMVLMIGFAAPKPAEAVPRDAVPRLAVVIGCVVIAPVRIGVVGETDLPCGTKSHSGTESQ